MISGIQKKEVFEGNHLGEIILNATEKIIINDSLVGSFVDQNAIGSSGDVLIDAGSFDLVNGAYLYTLSNAKGNSGNIIINVRDEINLKGLSNDDNLYPSQIANQIQRYGEGNGGNTTINARSLSLADGASIQTATIGKGNAGNIFIRVNDYVSLEKSTILDTTQIRTAVEAGAIGNGGNIDIQARSLSLTDGSQLAASVSQPFGNVLVGGQGRGGQIIINASDSVSISGTGYGFSSGIVAETELGAVGNAGNITINTDLFHLSDGGIVDAKTRNSGTGGNIIINANNIDLLSGGQVQSNAFSSGNAGNISINAVNRLTLSGSDPNYADRLSQFGEVVTNEGAASGVFANTRLGSSGRGGNISIQANWLDLNNSAQIDASTFGQGNAGNIVIQDAHSVTIDNGSISTRVGAEAIAQGGNINIQAHSLNLNNGAQINASTAGRGNAGNISVQNNNDLTLDNNSKISTEIAPSAIATQPSNIDLYTQNLSLANGSRITTATSGQGDAGKMGS